MNKISSELIAIERTRAERAWLHLSNSSDYYRLTVYVGNRIHRNRYWYINTPMDAYTHIQHRWTYNNIHIGALGGRASRIVRGAKSIPE